VEEMSTGRRIAEIRQGSRAGTHGKTSTDRYNAKRAWREENMFDPDDEPTDADLAAIDADRTVDLDDDEYRDDE
jgi:hypothetical protein